MLNIQKTEQEILKDEILDINDSGEGAIQYLINTNQALYERFWQKPQEYCEIMGTEAYKFFEISAKTQAFIKSIRPEHTILGIPNGWGVVFNQDGTVTVTEVIEE